MDDLAVCVQGESPDQVVRKVRLVTGRLLELCMEHCMSPNVSKNKTEILFSFRGKQSRKQKTKFYGPAASSALPVLTEYGVVDVPLTTSYRHFTSCRRPSGRNPQKTWHCLDHAQSSPQASVSQLGNTAWKTPAAPGIFGAQQAPLRCRDLVCHWGCNSPIFSCGSDQTLPTASSSTCCTAPSWSWVHLPSSPIDLIRRSRLRHIATLMRCGKRQEWGLLASDITWTSLLEDDLVWMWQQVHHSS